MRHYRPYLTNRAAIHHRLAARTVKAEAAEEQEISIHHGAFRAGETLGEARQNAPSLLL
jgi:hypothetical protein